MNPAETYESALVPARFGPSAEVLLDLAGLVAKVRKSVEPILRRYDRGSEVVLHLALAR